MSRNRQERRLLKKEGQTLRQDYERIIASEQAAKPKTFFARLRRFFKSDPPSRTEILLMELDFKTKQLNN